MSRTPTTPRPPRWILLVSVAAIPAWLLGAYWLNNQYSGWSRLAAVYPADGRDLANPLGPTSVTIVQASGRHFSYETKKGYKQTVAGFDDEGFWVRARGSGWFSGPHQPVFVPWDAVEGCRRLRVELRHPPVALILRDQGLIDACRRHAGGG